eukprot:25565-Ditylum_brightwellii.AAC.1
MMNLAIQGKHTPERWKTIYNLHLLKEAGIYRRHWLRMLHIIDAELNLMKRELIARRLMRHAEFFEHLSGNQYRGRKGRAAIDHMLTAYGLSEQKKFHSKDHPVHGVGQGP